MSGAACPRHRMWKIRRARRVRADCEARDTANGPDGDSHRNLSPDAGSSRSSSTRWRREQQVKSREPSDAEQTASPAPQDERSFVGAIHVAAAIDQGQVPCPGDVMRALRER